MRERNRTRSALDLEGLAALLRRDARRRVLLRLRLELALRELRPHLGRGGRRRRVRGAGEGAGGGIAQGRSPLRWIWCRRCTPGRGHRAAARRAPWPVGWRSRSSSGHRPCAPPPSSSPPAWARRASAPPESERRIAAVVRHRRVGAEWQGSAARRCLGRTFFAGAAREATGFFGATFFGATFFTTFFGATFLGAARFATAFFAGRRPTERAAPITTASVAARATGIGRAASGGATSAEALAARSATRASRSIGGKWVQSVAILWGREARSRTVRVPRSGLELSLRHTLARSTERLCSAMPAPAQLPPIAEIRRFRAGRCHAASSSRDCHRPS